MNVSKYAALFYHLAGGALAMVTLYGIFLH